MDKQIIKKDNNIIVNFFCICKRKNKVNDKFKVVLPCCHIFHDNCLNNYCNNSKSFTNEKNVFNYERFRCPLCQTQIKKVLDEKKIFRNKKYSEIQKDLITVRMNNTGYIDYLSLPFKIMSFVGFINYLIQSKYTQEFISSAECLLKICNVKINLINNSSNNDIKIINNKIIFKNNQKNIIISNHSNYLDTFILYYLFVTGFIASEFITSTDFGRLLSNKCKLLIFNRNVDKNMVEKIKEYLEEMKQIIIFPEGVMKDNNDTLMKFRTGSFYTGANICPVVIKYRNYINDEDMKQSLFKLITQAENIVDIYILPTEYPPFNDEKIENIREKMAKVGNFKLSRVSNKN